MRNNILQVILLLCSSMLFSATYVVVNNSDVSVPGSLRYGVNNTSSGDLIVFDTGLANQTITLTSTLTIPVSKNITIDGSAAPNISISGNNLVRIFLVQSNYLNATNLTLKNLRLINGFTDENGAAIKTEQKGILNITNCTFIGNNAEMGGSAIYSGFEGKSTIQNCTFNNNISVAANNESGSTVFLFGPSSQVIKNSNFNNNKGINGAAIHGLNAPILIEDCNFNGNNTLDAVFDTGQPQDFLRGFGGAIYTDRATTLPSSTLGSIIIRRSKFEGNKGRSEGGAAYLYTGDTDNVLIEDCNFNNNEVLGLPGGGGANSSAGGAISQMNNSKNKGFILRNSTFSNNKSIEGAGAVRVFYADTKIENCTFFNNKSTLVASDGYGSNGGALALSSVENSDVEITNSTFANNFAGWVAGAIIGPASIKIKNNIFSNNTSVTGGNNYGISQHSSDQMTDLGGNIQTLSTPNDNNVSAVVIIANPQLLPLADNGGFTQTMAIPATSPAVNNGSGCNTSPPKDQRGAPRVGVCDSGAFEYGSTVLGTADVDFVNRKVIIYPNPSKDGEFHVKIPKTLQAGPILIEIYSLEGKLVFKKSFSNDAVNFKIQQKGIFLLKTTTNVGVSSDKIIFK